jgi:hypothetical protein
MLSQRIAAVLHIISPARKPASLLWFDGSGQCPKTGNSPQTRMNARVLIFAAGTIKFPD